jgi:hypothetical protein
LVRQATLILMVKHVSKTFSLTADTLNELDKLSKYFDISQSAALRLAILEMARKLVINTRELKANG